MQNGMRSICKCTHAAFWCSNHILRSIFYLVLYLIHLRKCWSRTTQVTKTHTRTYTPFTWCETVCSICWSRNDNTVLTQFPLVAKRSNKYRNSNYRFKAPKLRIGNKIEKNQVIGWHWAGHLEFIISIQLNATFVLMDLEMVWKWSNNNKYFVPSLIGKLLTEQASSIWQICAFFKATFN